MVFKSIQIDYHQLEQYIQKLITDNKVKKCNIIIFLLIRIFTKIGHVFHIIEDLAEKLTSRH